MALFKGAKPSVRLFHESLNRMLPEERTLFMDRTFGLALAGWPELTGPYRAFMVRLIKANRQSFVDYVRHKTVLGELLCGLDETDLFLKIVNLWMQPHDEQKPSYTELSFSLLLAFDMDLSVKYLGDKIRYARMDAFDFADLLERGGDIG